MIRSLMHCSEYPRLLKEIKQPPEVIYALGNVEALNQVPAVAIVGARNCDKYGREVAFELAYQLAALGVCVVSGLAYGIDTAAHEGSLKSAAKVPTVAVLAQGLQTEIYPRKNLPLVHRIVEQGGVVLSHFAPTASPLPQNFLERNRIIAGLCSVVVVVEASEKSGSLVTARFALEEGREVCVVPGQIDNPRAAGSNALIQQGATLVTNVNDILSISDTLSHLLKIAEELPSGISADVSEPAKAILRILKQDSALHFQQLYDRLACKNENIQEYLLELELIDAISRQPGNYFTITIKGSKMLLS